VRPQAGTPEELESLFEDTLILGDRDAIVSLFDEHAVMAADAGSIEARGAWEIARLSAVMRERGYAYVAEPRRIVQASSTALVVAERAVNVMHRGPEGGWRYAISLINTDHLRSSE
jgi:hypothetical protein